MSEASNYPSRDLGDPFFCYCPIHTVEIASAPNSNPWPFIMKSGVALKVLDCYYQTVILLKEFIEHICSTEVSLQQDDDPDHYISLLNMTYIATNEPLDASTKAKFSKVEAICKMYEVGLKRRVQSYNLTNYIYRLLTGLKSGCSRQPKENQTM